MQKSLTAALCSPTADSEAVAREHSHELLKAVYSSSDWNTIFGNDL